MKGAGTHGGPTGGTGQGPVPARHIPWPEIFKHHISLVEGHLRMVDMIRKHTVEGSGNWTMIMALVERTNEMLRVSKHQAKTFVPPPRQREEVPLGSSSASMYPGYSPADHEYGKAAEEYGEAAAEARRRGLDISHPDVEYRVGQNKGIKRRTLAEMRAAKAAKDQGSGTGPGSVSEEPTTSKPKEHATLDGAASRKRPQAATVEAEGDNPYFVIDTKPTPVRLSGMPNPLPERSISPPLRVSYKKHKIVKNQHVEELPCGEGSEQVELEDISEEVDARLKVKEERRKRKEEKKRKRESNDDNAPTAPSTKAEDLTTAAIETDKPNAKRVKKSIDEVLADRSIQKKRTGEDNEEAETCERKKRKKRRKGNGAIEEA